MSENCFCHDIRKYNQITNSCAVLIGVISYPLPRFLSYPITTWAGLHALANNPEPTAHCGCPVPPPTVYPPILYEGPLWPTDMDDWARDWRDTQVVNPTPLHSPLILDLNRDGRLKMDNWTYFDYTANGMHEWATWIDADDAFLVLDLNGDGIINNGSEMFGTSTMLPNGKLALDGWDALRQYDTNGDGKIDANDEIFASLMVLTGDGRLASLTDAGIKSITIPPLPPGGPNGSSSGQWLGMASSGGGGSSGGTSVQLTSPWQLLTQDERNQYLIDQARALDAAIRADGGVYWGSSVFEWEDGTTSEIVDAYPYRMPMYSIAGEWLEVPEDIAALPDLIGFGNKHDLHQAMVRDESGALRALVDAA